MRINSSLNLDFHPKIYKVLRLDNTPNHILILFRIVPLSSWIGPSCNIHVVAVVISNMIRRTGIITRIRRSPQIDSQLPAHLPQNVFFSWNNPTSTLVPGPLDSPNSPVVHRIGLLLCNGTITTHKNRIPQKQFTVYYIDH